VALFWIFNPRFGGGTEKSRAVKKNARTRPSKIVTENKQLTSMNANMT
jgi:hypothetical protein